MRSSPSFQPLIMQLAKEIVCNSSISILHFTKPNLFAHAIQGDADLLWQYFKAGSREAFEKIYRTHIRGHLNYGYKVTSDKRLIEDSVQDMFFELWNHRSGLSDIMSIRFYLFKALRYKIGPSISQNTGY